MPTPLERLSPSLAYPVNDAFGAPDADGENTVHRAFIRDLIGMQKEGVVTNTSQKSGWRLSSDEGDYLDGADIAPPPLGNMAAGMVAAYFDSLLGVADNWDASIEEAEITLDNFYTMQGSALRGDMSGGALPPELTVHVEVDGADPEDLVQTAVDRSPVTALVRTPLDNLFTLIEGGERIPTDRVSDFDGDVLPDPAESFQQTRRPETTYDPDPVTHTGAKTEEPPAEHERYTEGESSSLEAEQDRVLHVRGEGSLRDDGLYHILQKIYSPRASMFEFLADRDPALGGEGRAPDAMSYVAAGIGFCFMTQFGRYAEIRRKELDGYRIVQDLPWSGRPSESGTVDPLITHVFLDTPEGTDFARELLDFSEQTCFLHALCGESNEPQVTIEST